MWSHSAQWTFYFIFSHSSGKFFLLSFLQGNRFELNFVTVLSQSICKLGIHDSDRLMSVTFTGNYKFLFCLFVFYRNCLGGWPAFFISLLVIAGLTALVEQVDK